MVGERNIGGRDRSYFGGVLNTGGRGAGLYLGELKMSPRGIVRLKVSIEHLWIQFVLPVMAS